MLRFLQREMGKRLSEVLQSDSDLHCVTDGKSIYLEDKQERIIDILKNAKQPMFLVCVSDQVRRLNDSPRKPMKAEAHPAAPAVRCAALSSHSSAHIQEDESFCRVRATPDSTPRPTITVTPTAIQRGGTCNMLAPIASPTIMTINPTM